MKVEQASLENRSSGADSTPKDLVSLPTSTDPFRAPPTPLVYRIARHASEIDALQRLLYQTFVIEIPQHPSNPEQRLVDRFHPQNTYFVCMKGAEIVGTVAYRAQRPFSLDLKLGSVDPYLPRGRRLCELRLLAVVSRARHSRVAAGLLQVLAQYAIGQGCDAAVISGTTRQQKLYRHLGFKPFGPKVGTAEVSFQPMYLSLEAYRASQRANKPPLPASREIL